MKTAAIAGAIVIVLDSAGIGELPDAADYGDAGIATLADMLGIPNEFCGESLVSRHSL